MPPASPCGALHTTTPYSRWVDKCPATGSASREQGMAHTERLLSGSLGVGLGHVMSSTRRLPHAHSAQPRRRLLARVAPREQVVEHALDRCRWSRGHLRRNGPRGLYWLAVGEQPVEMQAHQEQADQHDGARPAPRLPPLVPDWRAQLGWTEQVDA